jgi:hypothetical protein
MFGQIKGTSRETPKVASSKFGGIEPLETRLLMSAAPKPVITITGNSTVFPEETINVEAVTSTFGTGDVLHDTIKWDFGDPGSAYDDLIGFNAAHAYAKPGAYTITLTITAPNGQSGSATAKVTVSTDTRQTIYVSTGGNDKNNGLSSSAPIKSITRLNQLLTNDTRVLFQSGDTFDTSTFIDDANFHDVYFGAYGSGAQPVIMWTGAKTSGGLIYSAVKAVGLTIQGLTFNSIYANNGDVGTLPDAIHPAGSEIAVLGCTFYNVQYDVDLNTTPTNVLIQGNSSPSMTALNGYFAWVQGSDIAIVGNTVANSVGESDIRLSGADIAGANLVLVADNTLGNTLKSSINIQVGTYAYVYGNDITSGPMGVGPVYNTLPASVAAPESTFEYCVFDSNTIYSTILVQPNAIYTLARNNLIYTNGQGGSGFVINAVTPNFPNRQVQYVYLLNNTVFDPGEEGGFLTLNSGQALDVVIDDNLFVAPHFVTGAGSGIIYVADDNLDSFSQIMDNVWPVASPIAWANGGVFYMNSDIGVRSGYLTPTEWEDTGVPKGDVYDNVILPTGIFDVTLDGFTAGSDVGSSTASSSSPAASTGSASTPAPPKLPGS